MIELVVISTGILFLVRHLTQGVLDVRNARRAKLHVFESWAKGVYIWVLYATMVGSCLVFGMGHRTGVWIGVTLLWVGCGLGLASLFSLGGSYSFEICLQNDFQLVTDGIYRVLRHPMRIGLAVESLGFVFLCGKPPLLLVWGAIVALQVVRTRHEEAFLVAHLGDAYRKYREESGLRLFLHAANARWRP